VSAGGQGGTALAAQPRVEVRVEVEPRWPIRLGRVGSADGLLRVRKGVLHRLVHEHGDPVHLRVAQLASGRVLFGASARYAAHAHRAIARMRRALGVDLDLAPFHRRFRYDPLIGAALRSDPTLRVPGRPDPFEALAWAICEQLIEYERAVAIERRLIARLGPRCPLSGLRDAPGPGTIAAQAPALLQSLDLAAGRAISLRRAAREIVAGRIDLDEEDHERTWRRLRAIPGIGRWTVEMLALTGQGRCDQLPAGDLGLLKLVGRLRSGGDPAARATEEQVRELFAPYGPWSGLAGTYALRAPAGPIRSALAGA
jgi:3-methyladenine DNA glycosylase/8-oxoguanine DNA glycosylase